MQQLGAVRRILVSSILLCQFLLDHFDLHAWCCSCAQTACVSIIQAGAAEASNLQHAADASATQHDNTTETRMWHDFVGQCHVSCNVSNLRRLVEGLGALTTSKDAHGDGKLNML